MFNQLLCPDATASFLHIFDFSIAPTLLFYSYIPIVVISLILAIYILVKDKFSLQSKLLFCLSAAFSVWVIDQIIQWIGVYASVVHFAWQIICILEVSILIFAAYFTYVFLHKKDLPLKVKLFLSLFFLSVVVLMPTDLNISTFDLQQCQSNYGSLWGYIYIFEVSSIVIIMYMFYKKFRSISSGDSLRKQIVVLASGIFLFLGAFTATNVIGDSLLVYQFNLIGPIGMVAFLVLLAFMIVRFKSFNIKAYGAQFLVIALIALIGSEFFFLESITATILAAVTLVITGFIGINLMRSVKKEIEAKEREHAQREIIEKQKNELEIANKKLEAFDVLKSKFLSLASHQLRNPISSIIYCTSMFLDGSFGEISELQKKMLSQMFQGAQDMNEDVEKYLTLAKIDQSGLQYNLKELDMADLVGSMTERQKLVAKNKGLDLSFETDGNSPYLVNGDKIQLKQVVQNLIDNAMKFTKEGWIKVNLSKDQTAKKIRLVVSDSGRGIKPEIIPTLFKEFSRGDGAQVDVGGSGIGIYAAKEIIEKGHNGKVWVESEGDGKGSQFHVELPIK